MRDKLNQFMQGRYGNDDLNRFLMKIILAAFVLSIYRKNRIWRRCFIKPYFLLDCISIIDLLLYQNVFQKYL